MQTQTKLQHSPFIRVKAVYRSHNHVKGLYGVKCLGDINTWMINLNKVTRIKDCGWEDLIINDRVAARVPITEFFFGFAEDESDEQTIMAVMQFEAIEDLVSCWEFTYLPKAIDDE